MFCKCCGKEIMDDAVICIHCGCSTKEKTAKEQTDAPSAGIAVLSAFFPIIGLIIWLAAHDTQPLMARSAGKGALIGVVVVVAFIILVNLLTMIAISNPRAPWF